MKKKSITENYIYNLTYQLILLLIPLFTTPYLTRVLGAEKLGIYSYTYSIVTIFFLISALGINTYGQREIAYAQDDIKKRSKIFWELMIIRFISTIICILSLFIFSNIASKYSSYYIIFLIYIISNIFDITWLFQGIEEFKTLTIKNIIVKVLYFVAIFIFIKTRQDLGIYILLFSLSTLLTNISFWTEIKKYIKKSPIKELNIKRHCKHIIIFFIPQISSLIYTVLDKTMLGIICSNIKNVSFYEQSTYIVKTILMLITTVGTVMMTKVSSSYQKNDFKQIKIYLNEIINFVWLSGCALTFGICAVVQNIVPWLFGPEYMQVISLVYVLCPLIIIIGLNNILGIQYLISTKKQNKYVNAVIIGAITNFILNIILINLLQTYGAAIASIVAELIILIIELYYIRNEVKDLNLLKNSSKYILFGIIMFAIVFPLNYILKPSILYSLIEIVIGAIVYISLLVISKDKFLYSYILTFFKDKLKGSKVEK